MPPKSKDVSKKLPPPIIRPVISDSSLVYIPDDVVEGFQERIETGIAWTLIYLAARHHKRYRDQEVPVVKFSEALQNKIKSSVLSGFLDPDSNLSLQEQFEVIVPITIWDNEKFSTEEGKICFKSDNSLTDDIMTLLKKVVRLDDRELLIKELRRVPILRLLDSKMTELDQELLKFKNLTTLNLCGNFISKLDAACLPRCLRVLELQSNYIKSVEDFANNLPENLMYLGLSSNFLADEGLELLAQLPSSIRVLDLSDNDIYTLDLVLETLAPLPGLRGLLLAGNPCAMCAAYYHAALSRLPLIRWLDGREVFPSDRPEDPFDPHPDDLRSAYFTFGVIRIMSTPQPPKTEKGVTTTFHVELELPLLDTHRRAFLMFRRNESLVEFLPPPEDDEWPPAKSRQSSVAPSKALFGEENVSRESNIYDHLVAKNSREIINFRIFETNKIQWNKTMNFQEPAVRIFCPDLKTLRDTFRSEITLRFVYTMILPPLKLGKVEKKSLPSLKPPPSEQRVVLATVKCALRRPDWSQPQQHFHWDDSLETHDAIHWGDGDLAISQVYNWVRMAVDSGGPIAHERWGSQTEYLLSCLGYAVGIGNIWRFPYLCYRNGGGAFLIPYFLTLLFCGIPLVYLETTLGQFASAGCISVFNLNPLFKGAGYAVIVLNVIAVTYFATIMAYPILYMYHSFSSPLPWQYCGNAWNTIKCREFVSDNSTFFSSASVKTPEDEFFHNGLLRMSPGIEEIGGIVWPLFYSNIICWVIVYLCICNGVKSVGKVVYVTVLFPYIVLSALLVRGLTLPGAWQGIQFYILPDWGQLRNPKVWVDAATQIFFSLGPGWGGLVSMASFNKFNYDNYRSSVVIPLVNSGTSIFAGFVVFSVLGFAAERTGVPVGEVASAGPGLAFVTYPATVTMMPAPNLWALVFFLMLFFLGIDTMFVTIEAVIAGILDEWPYLRIRKRIITFFTCFVLFCLSIICNTEGGLHILNLLDTHVAIAGVPVICALELAAAVYTYGADRLSADVMFMTGRPLRPFWRMLWRYVVPVILLVITAYSLREAAGWMGWCIALASVICVPIHGTLVIIRAEGPFLQRIKKSCQPNSEWGPSDPDIRQKWLEKIGKANWFEENISLDEISDAVKSL